MTTPITTLAATPITPEAPPPGADPTSHTGALSRMDEIPPGWDATPPVLVQPVRAALGSFVREPSVRLFSLVLFITTGLAQTAAVILVVVWSRGVAVSELGLIGGAFVLGDLCGGLVFTTVTARLSRYVGVALGFLVGGGTIFVLRGAEPTALFIVVVAFVAGLAWWSVTPGVQVLVSRRTPARLHTRVSAIAASLAFVGIPLGTYLAALALDGMAATVAILVACGALLAAMLVPILVRRGWQELMPDVPVVEAATGRSPKLPARVSVTLAYADGQWIVEVRKGRALLGSRHPVKSAEALQMLALLDVPTVQHGVERALTTDQTEASRQVDRMRAELAELEAKLSGLTEMVQNSDARRQQ